MPKRDGALFIPGRFLFCFRAFLLISACQKEKLEPHLPDAGEQIRFDRPEVGQRSRYIPLEGEKYFAPQATDQWRYLPDTLIVEIVSQEGPGFLLKERLSAGSFSALPRCRTRIRCIRFILETPGKYPVLGINKLGLLILEPVLQAN